MTYEEIDSIRKALFVQKEIEENLRTESIADMIHKKVLKGHFKIDTDGDLIVWGMFIDAKGVKPIRLAASLMNRNIKLLSWNGGIVNTFHLKTLKDSDNKTAIMDQLNYHFYNVYDGLYIDCDNGHYFVYEKDILTQEKQSEFPPYHMILDPNQLNEE